MTDTLFERGLEAACRAACGADYDDPSHAAIDHPRDWWIDHHWHLYKRSAPAAILAFLKVVREPSQDAAIIVGDAVNAAPQTAVQAGEMAVAVYIDHLISEGER